MVVLTILVTLVLLFGCSFFLFRFLEVSARGKSNVTLWLKALASLCFLLLGLIYAGWCDNEYWKIISPVALLMGFVGDILLEADLLQRGQKLPLFLVGGIAFALEHYAHLMLNVCAKGSTILFGLAVLVIGGIAVLVLFRKYRVALHKFGVPCVCYYVLLLISFGVALGTLFLNGSFGTFLFFLSSALFLFSDTVLVLNRFGTLRGGKTGLLICGSYYAAQVLIAVSLLAR